MSAWMLPEVWLVLGAVLLLLLEGTLFNAKQVGWLALALLAGVIGLTYLNPLPVVLFWESEYSWDPLARFFKIFFFVTTALVIWLSLESEGEVETARAEFYVLPLFVAAGLSLLASARDLMVLFVALELVTVSFYILVAYQRSSVQSLEAGVKYLIMGALSSSFLVMGIAYVFGTTNSMHYDTIQSHLTGQVPSAGLSFGLLLILAGIGFKIATVPFHVWAPDVYEGAPTPVTAFLAIGSKAGGFILLLNVLTTPFGDPAVVQIWAPVLYVLAGLSLVMGNLGAIPQRSLKRMLAYSGIGHAGYILIGVATNSELGRVAVVVYLVTYLLGAGTAFLALVLARKKIQNDMIYSFAGLVQRAPFLAFALAIGLVSMAGIPPTAGFFGKFLILSAAWEAHQYGMVVLAVFSAVAGLYYYLGVVRYMFWSEPVDTDSIPLNIGSRLVLGLMVFLLIGLGLWMQPVLVAVQQALF